MIQIELTGGTGNQLFEWALGRALSKEGYDVEYNLKNYWAGCPRPFSLFKLGLDKTPVTWTSAGILPVVDEGAFSFQDRLLTPPKDCTMRGYFQSEKYFSKYAEEIRSDLRVSLLGRPRQPKTDELLDKILEGNSCSIHVRRGDYLKPAHRDFHGVLGIGYYMHAVSYIQYVNSFDPVNFYVFSDDPDWCKSQFVTTFPTMQMHVVDHTVDSEHEDLLLMSMCKDAIIANSSFSWWGAWSRIPQPPVQDWDGKPAPRTVAPTLWFKNTVMQAQAGDVVPNSWARI